MLHFDRSSLAAQSFRTFHGVESGGNYGIAFYLQHQPYFKPRNADEFRSYYVRRGVDETLGGDVCRLDFGGILVRILEAREIFANHF